MKKTLGIAAVFLFLAGIGVGRWAVPATPRFPVEAMATTGQNGLDSVDTGDYARTWRLIREKHINVNVTDSQLFYGSVAGLVDSLDDPYSVYLDPRRAAIAAADFSGSFSGIGVEIGQKEGRLTVISPIADSPGAKAGLLAGDIITAIDGKDTSGMKVDEAVSKIRGERGKPVKLTIYREGSSATRDIEIVRDTISLKSVKTKTVTSGGKTLMIVTISHFSADTSEAFEKASQEALAAKVDGMVIDLRNDPGGLLNVAMDVTCHWAAGVPLVYMDPRGGPREPSGCMTGDTLKNLPTAVLVNKGSASASEIMAGALQDLGKARVIGETTYGKGCGQSVFDFPDGAQLRLTTFLWKTPKGRTIDKTGITPDEVLKADPKDIVAGKDVQLDRALQYLSTGR